ncbi:uncharacterized protein LOC110250303 [Exaiptasia diaphana]|uniref:THAP-type domain-containing protein n=1 Tax=Exaiptasia diaphana TaxID=2652724 RepID=A0A913Y081_EXADI|nr:uncharacterized protein LOC110250303 [Exaiptasia diaphana]
MVLRCCWGTCKVDQRYPVRLKGVKFIPFPKPKRNLQKCMKWIKNCDRKHEILNVDRINKHKAVCSTHFVGGNGQTELWPDPIPADGSPPVPARIPVRRRISDEFKAANNISAKKMKLQSPSNEEKDQGEFVAMEMST